jgi:hypothetical protein
MASPQCPSFVFKCTALCLILKEDEKDNNSTLVSIKVFLGKGYIHLSEVTGTVLTNSQNLKYIFPQKTLLRLRTVIIIITPRQFYKLTLKMKYFQREVLTDHQRKKIT